MSESGNKMSKNKKITIFAIVALVVIVKGTIGIMVYYKLGPFSIKSDALLAAPNRYDKRVPKENVKKADVELKCSKKKLQSENCVKQNMYAVSPLCEKNDVASDNSDISSLDAIDTSVSDGDNDILLFSNENVRGSPSAFLSFSYCSAEFDFEKNTGIKDRKASMAYIKLQFLDIKDIDDCARLQYNADKANHDSTNVKFTNTSNIGIVYVLARYFALRPKMIDRFCEYVPNVDNTIPSLMNLLVELSCHIKMRKNNGKVSLWEYNEYLYTIDIFQSLKKIMYEAKDVNRRAHEEAILINSQEYGQRMFRLQENDKNGIIPKNYIDEIIPPKQKRSRI